MGRPDQAGRIQQIAHMVDEGIRPEIITETMGYKNRRCLHDTLRRAGRPDLAEQFNRNHNKRRAEQIEDIEFLLAHKTPVHDITRRVLGGTPLHAERMLSRAGREDLAKVFRPEGSNSERNARKRRITANKNNQQGWKGDRP